MIPQLFNAQMAQYATPTITGESSVVIEDGIKCYLPELKISGQTIQRQCGINMMDISKIKTTSGTNVSIKSVNSSTGEVIIKTAEQISGTFNGYTDTGIQFKEIFPNMEIGKTYYLYGDVTTDNNNTSIRKSIYINKLQKFWNYGNPLTIDESLYNTTGNLIFYANTTPGATTTISNLMIVESDIVEQVSELKYESYQPLSPDYPQDIINAGNKRIEVIVKGKNLFDVKNSEGFKDNWGTISSVIEGNTIITTSTYTGNRGSTLKLGTFPAGNYCISYEQWGYPDDAFIGIWVNDKGINQSLTKNTKYQQLTLTEESLISLYYAVPTKMTIFISGLQIIEGNYNEKPEYEPYAESQIIKIPSIVTKDNGEKVELRFARYDDSDADILMIDSIKRKVTYIQCLERVILKSDQGIWYNYLYAGQKGVYASPVLPQSVGEHRQKGFCSHEPKEHVGNYYQPGGIWIHYSQIYWLSILTTLGLSSVDDFLSWLKKHEDNGHPFECVYILPEPIPHDITDSPEGRELLGLIQNNGTTIIEIKNTNNLSQTLSAKYLTHS